MKGLGGDYFYDPDYNADLKDEWRCEQCGAGNSRMDGECQYCECEGKTCKRGNCSGTGNPLDEHPGLEVRPEDHVIAGVTVSGDRDWLRNLKVGDTFCFYGLDDLTPHPPSQAHTVEEQHTWGGTTFRRGNFTTFGRDSNIMVFKLWIEKA